MKYFYIGIGVVAITLAICVRALTSNLVREPAVTPELASAIKRSRNSLEAFRQRLRRPQSDDRMFFLRAGIAEPGKRTEILWIKNVRCEGREFTGVLAEEPFSLASIHAGTTVAVKDSDVVDWAIKRADGSREGNFTAGLEPGH